MVDWPDLAKICHFGNVLKVCGNFLSVYVVFVKFLIYLGNYFTVGQIFIHVNEIKSAPEVFNGPQPPLFVLILVNAKYNFRREMIHLVSNSRRPRNESPRRTTRPTQCCLSILTDCFFNQIFVFKIAKV